MALTKVIGSGVQGISNSSDATAITISSSEAITLSNGIQLESSGPTITLTDTAGTNDITTLQCTGGALIVTARDGSSDGEIIFKKTDGSATDETLRIRSGGFLRASPNSTVTNSRLSATTAHVFHSHTDGSIMFFLENTQSDPYGMMFDFSQAAPDDNTNFFMKFEDSSAERGHIYSDGDMRNHDGTFSQASDERIKQNVTDANSQWDDIKAIRFINYKAKDDVRQYGEDSAKVQLGVLAQEMEKISPKLIKQYPPSKADVASSSEFGTLYEDGDTIPDDKVVGDVKEIKENVKGIAYSVLYMKSVKALQEAMTRIETLEAKVKVLEG
tara:strand:- start:51 stop:1034 length:984 start_codon:yes stop_codon:yes gene_type:complete